MNLKRVQLKFTMLAAMLLIALISHGQTPGFIYKQANSTLGRLILDPNGDGYTSASPSGFTTTGTSPKLLETNSELKMIPIPVIMEEPLGDPVTGGSGGQTDIVSAGGSQSVYLLKRTVNSIDYLIIRFRLGTASNASKGFSLLLETDRTFGTPLSPNNLGFDREIVYETGNNGRIVIYKHELNKPGQVLKAFNVHDFSQRSYATSRVGGNQNVFYDFCVPIRDIDATEFVRLCAVTVTSAGSGITGTIADFNGINDKLYGNNTLLLQTELINGFPELNFDEMDENFNPDNLKLKTKSPHVNSPINVSNTSVSGTSIEPENTRIRIYRYNNNLSDSVFIGETTVNSNGVWSHNCSTACGLSVGHKVFARAFADNKLPSDLSNEVTIVGTASCFLPAPRLGNPSNGATSVPMFWDIPSGFTGTVTFELFNITAPSTVLGTALTADFVNSAQTSGTTINSTTSFSYAIGGTGNVNNITFFATARTSSCASQRSNHVCNGASCAGSITAPVVNTDPILTNTTTIQVRNAHGAAATLVLYKNGTEITRTGSTISANTNHDFASISNLFVGERITARAEISGNQSAVSNVVVVTAPALDTSLRPFITGSYTAGSGRTVNGTSPSPPGTTIWLYLSANDSVSTQVDAFGTWSITGLTLTVNQQLVARAITPGYSLSGTSNQVTVLPAPPSAPVITTDPILAGITSSISGTVSGSSDSIVLYIDGVRIGVTTATSGNWTLNNIPLDDLYINGNITAVNFFGGSPAPSNEKPVTGPDNFLIEYISGGAVPSKKAGEPFNVKITARDINNNTFSNYNTANMFSSSGVVANGSGPSNNFNNGQLNTHSLTLTKAGTHDLFTISENLPNVTGKTSVTIVPEAPVKLTLVTKASRQNAPNSAFSTQPVLALTDVYGNAVVDDAQAGTITVSIISENGQQTITGVLSSSAGLTITLPTTGAAQGPFSDLKFNKNGIYVVEFSSSRTGITPVIDTIIVSQTKMWYGLVSSAYSNPNNWVSSGTGGQESDVPTVGENVEFYVRPGHKCALDSNVTLGSIIIASTNADSAIFDLNGHTLLLQGQFELSNEGKIKADGSNSHLHFKGNRFQAQRIPKNGLVNTTVYKLTIDNPNGVQLQGSNHDINIANSLIFTNGVFQTLRASNSVIFLATSTSGGGNSNSYIEGVCTKIGDAAFVFPIGRSGRFAPCGISAPSAANHSFSAEYFPVNYVSNTLTNNSFSNRKINGTSQSSRALRKVSTKEYWEINRNVGSAKVNVSLYWLDKNYSEITSLSGLTVVHYDKKTNNHWENASGNGNVIPKELNGTPVSNLNTVPNQGILTLEDVDEFSPFTYGDEDNLSLLDMQLNKFTAKAINNHKVLLNWQTNYELNSSHFEIQRSTNTEDWETIGTVTAQSAGYQQSDYQFYDLQPQPFNYYQLKYFGIEQDAVYSNIIFVRMNSDDVKTTKIYPNPGTGTVHVETNEISTYTLRNCEGKIIDNRKVENKHTIENLSSGMYFIQIQKGNLIENHKLIVY
jgi:hypothetical protein